jgi:Na+-transporting methylmalonyl-CoA/oxaloacetate decarboxylase gamma subunit
MYLQRRFQMWNDVVRTAAIGFSVVFITLWLLAVTVKVMSFLVRAFEKKGGKKDA